MVSENTKELIKDLGYDYRLNKIILSDIPENDKLLLVEIEKCYRLSNLKVETRSAEDEY